VPDGMYHGYLILLKEDCHLWQILAPVPNRRVAYTTRASPPTCNGT